LRHHSDRAGFSRNGEQSKRRHGQLHQYPKQLHRYRQCQQCRQHQRERQYRPDQNGITIDNSSVGGAISNSGTITASNIGIAVGTSEFVANTATVSGGITNGGTTSITGSSLTAAGISITNVTSASGGISNSGEILAGAGGGGISLQQMTSFSGGISNTGTIVTGQDQSAISAGLISTFIGEVSNSGSITVGGPATVLACRSECSPAMSKTAGRSRRRAVSAYP
jgi:hypothetical protein